MKPRLLDLFCGAGGCSVGYARAGFYVAGVDLEPCADYPFFLDIGDAFDFLHALNQDEEFGASYDVVHASPPCQGYTTMSNRHRGNGGPTDDHPRWIGMVREQLEEWSRYTGGLYVIENVVGARKFMRDPFLLRGGMFGLGVDRPRLFESNALIFNTTALPLDNPVGVYGKCDGRRLFDRADGTIQRAAASLEEAQRAMGIDWMAWNNLREAIPPTYTEFIGSQLLSHSRAAA